MKAELNQIRIDNNFSPLAAVLAERVLIHVYTGGFLGANAEHYSMGLKDHNDRIVLSGWNFNQKDIDQGWLIAVQFEPNLWEISINNFNNLDYY